MTREDRESRILQEVIEKRTVSVNDLAKMFNVTMETIRKDIASLQEKNIVAKNYGQVSLADPYLEDEFLKKETQDLAAKTKIAQTALGLIPNNAVVYLDTSTTVLQLARLLSLRSNLTIVTNSLRINEVLSNNQNDILMTGGKYRDRSKSYYGDWTIRAIDAINIDIAFLGGDGLSADGVTIGSYGELTVKKEVIKRSKKTALMVSTSKFMKMGKFTYTNFSDVDLLITERELSNDEKLRFPKDFLLMN
ncbi:DeoR/GlpR family DNA-binding transcription regulator [Companilactobacillus kimchiensis]|uniref:HTH deoR-type domain-containing protein n=1 Tax=Companilactobacillus kimchiensis TaxID=993692 RepID=A0A0R2LAV8_9LACO|nr:DeoR/GlpR family DNA-binding transcription regulator [Companilactobacillus kimchiensis]KRN99010.1 hypothetical protein IV57_GL000580 [Companilactobacillus kimchiensis]